MPSPERTANVPSLANSSPAFVIGQSYWRKDDIHAKYGGSRQGGISPSSWCPAVFVFTGDTGEQYGYRDGFDESGVFSYSGEGRLGDMTFKGGNRALRDHSKDGKAVHLFHALGKGKAVRYMGEFVVASYSMRRGPDEQGNERDVIMFHLALVGTTDAPALSADSEVVAASTRVAASTSELRSRALQSVQASQGTAGSLAIRSIYERSKAVRDYVIARAEGKCEANALHELFQGRDGQPYLEAHHTTRLSDGGVDHPKHVVALCPMCHRRVHHGVDGHALNDQLKDWLARSYPNG